MTAISNEKVTRSLLREMKMGETRIFRVQNASAMDSAAVLAYQMQHHEQCKYICNKDHVNMLLKITKLAKE